MPWIPAFAGMTSAAFAGMTSAAFAGTTNAAFAGMTNTRLGEEDERRPAPSSSCTWQRSNRGTFEHEIHYSAQFHLFL